LPNKLLFDQQKDFFQKRTKILLMNNANFDIKNGDIENESQNLPAAQPGGFVFQDILWRR